MTSMEGTVTLLTLRTFALISITNLTKLNTSHLCFAFIVKEFLAIIESASLITSLEEVELTLTCLALQVTYHFTHWKVIWKNSLKSSGYRKMAFAVAGRTCETTCGRVCSKHMQKDWFSEHEQDGASIARPAKRSVNGCKSISNTLDGIKRSVDATSSSLDES